jgi:hypothetical protein
MNKLEIPEVDHIPGICIWCNKPFDVEKENRLYGHNECALNYEKECDIEWYKHFFSLFPPGTRFDLAGGASCD